MRKTLFAAVCLFLWASSPAFGTSYTLTVNVSGPGEAVSTPAGIDCVNNGFGSVTCSHVFSAGIALAVVATPADSDEFTSHFLNWSGDCSGSAACVLTMNSNKTVTANFGALSTPAFAFPLPVSGNVYRYLPTEEPLEEYGKGQCKPFAVGDVYGGTLNLKIGLNVYAGPVDVYVAMGIPGSGIFIWTPGNVMQPLSALGLVPWKTNHTGGIHETVYGPLPSGGLPSGTYDLYLVVTPAGSVGAYDLWITHFTL